MVDGAFCLSKGNHHLMEPAALSAGDLLKRAGNHCFSQNLTERGSIVNILRPFLCAKDRDFLRHKMLEMYANPLKNYLAAQ